MLTILIEKIKLLTRQNKQFKADLKSRLAAVNRKIDSFADIMDISKEDFNDLPSAKSSNESKASLSLELYPRGI